MADSDRFNTLRGAATYIWRDYGGWAYDTWAQYNRDYFAGKLTPAGIVWGLPPHALRMGNYDTAYNLITLYEGLLDAEASNPWGISAWQNRALAGDVLLHEMIHQRVQTTGCDYRSHNNEDWVAQVNRIAPLVGLEPNAQVIPQMREGNSLIWVADTGAMSRRELSRWPYLSRPDGFYPESAWQVFGDRMRGQ